MSNIFCRSPYIIRIAETGQLGSLIELTMWKGTGAAPTNFNYSLTKNIPAPLNYETLYNISPYIKEFIKHESYFNVYNQTQQSMADTSWTNVRVKRIKLTNVGRVLLDTNYYIAYGGYTDYTDGRNFDLGDILMDEGTYLYEYDAVNSPSSNIYKRAGSVSWYGVNGYKLKYTELNTGTVFNSTISVTKPIMSHCVYPNFYSNGNIMQILDASNNVLWESTYKPIIECKYTPVVIDFVNRYGGWQREFFFKASKDNVSVTNSTYNLMQESLWNFDTYEGQRKVFNSVMLQTIQVNSDWRDDSYAEVIRQLMLSERILLNGRPVKLNTQNTELFKEINNKMINYSLEFEYATDINNTVL